MQRSDAAKWRAAEIAEFQSHIKNKTFSEPVTPPAGFKPVPAAGVYKLKRDGRYKYRIVNMRGYHMKQGRDFNETFAPPAHISTLRVLLNSHSPPSTAGRLSRATCPLLSWLLPWTPSSTPRCPLVPTATPPARSPAMRPRHASNQRSFLWNKKSHKNFIDGGLTRSPT